MIIFGTFACGLNSVFNHASKHPDQTPYQPESVVFMSEVTKFVLSFFFLIREQNGVTAAIKRLRQIEYMHWLRWSVPSILYMMCNNLDWLILEYMDPATYQVC